MPFKANAARRHRIPKQRYRVTNWAEYDASPAPAGKPDGLVLRGSDCRLAGRASHDTRRSTPLFGPGDQDSVDAAGGVPAGAASDRRADRLDPPAPGSGSGGAGSLNPEPPRRNPGGAKAMSKLAEDLFTCWSTAQACGCADPASGWSRSTAPGGAGPGENCTSAWMLRPDRSSPQS